MNEQDNDNLIIPRIAFERMQAKDEHNDKWRNIIIIIMAILLAITIALHFISDAKWREAWSAYEYVEEYEIEAQQDGEGINIVGGGDIDYGTNSNNTQETGENTQSYE